MPHVRPVAAGASPAVKKTMYPLRPRPATSGCGRIPVQSRGMTYLIRDATVDDAEAVIGILNAVIQARMEGREAGGAEVVGLPGARRA